MMLASALNFCADPEVASEMAASNSERRNEIVVTVHHPFVVREIIENP